MGEDVGTAACGGRVFWFQKQCRKIAEPSNAGGEGPEHNPMSYWGGGGGARGHGKWEREMGKKEKWKEGEVKKVSGKHCVQGENELAEKLPESKGHLERGGEARSQTSGLSV